MLIFHLGPLSEFVVWSQQTGVREVIRSATKEQNNQITSFLPFKFPPLPINSKRCIQIKMEMCKHKCNNVTTKHDSFTDTSFSPSPSVPFHSGAYLSCRIPTNLYGKHLKCGDKHITRRRGGLLKHMAHMFLLLKVFWPSNLTSPNVKHIWKCR